MLPTQFVHGLRVGTDVPLQLFNTLLMLRPKQQREAKWLRGGEGGETMKRSLNTVCSLPPVGTNKGSVNGCRAWDHLVSCTMVVSITVQTEVLLLLGQIKYSYVCAEHWYLVLPLFPELLLSVGELLFLHPGLSQCILISTLLMLHLEKSGRQGKRRMMGRRKREEKVFIPTVWGLFVWNEKAIPYGCVWGRHE